ncbi:MAG: Fur family transcriptional regulator [Candidatus Izemoplasmatales bacterium]
MFDKSTFEKHDIKPSITRIKIYQYLLDNKHPSVDEIYQGLKNELPTLSKTTVYNVLNIFIDKSIVSAISLDSKEMRYEVNQELHSHFHCLKCGEIYDFPYVDVNYKSFHKEGFESLQHNLVIRGICKKCKELVS